jgi:hypothetical protein
MLRGSGCETNPAAAGMRAAARAALRFKMRFRRADQRSNSTATVVS